MKACSTGVARWATASASGHGIVGGGRARFALPAAIIAVPGQIVVRAGSIGDAPVRHRAAGIVLDRVGEAFDRLAMIETDTASSGHGRTSICASADVVVTGARVERRDHSSPCVVSQSRCSRCPTLAGSRLRCDAHLTCGRRPFLRRSVALMPANGPTDKSPRRRPVGLRRAEVALHRPAARRRWWPSRAIR